MNSLVLLFIGIALFLVAYVVYGGYLAKEWGIDPNRKTPAHTCRDDIDYCPANAKVLLGHHFSSIAGAGPITGPIAAAVFGWLPVYLWIIVGSIFFGGVHDWGSLLASVRHDGKSIGEIIRVTIGEKGKKLFNIFAFLTLILVVAAFTDICASTFAFDPAKPAIDCRSTGRYSINPVHLTGNGLWLLCLQKGSKPHHIFYSRCYTIILLHMDRLPVPDS